MSLQPQLPEISPISLNPLSETFSFHSSPENFIASRALSLHDADPSQASSRKPIRASILGRNVAVISSHAQVLHVLHQGKSAQGGSGGDENGVVYDEHGRGILNDDDVDKEEAQSKAPYEAAPAYSQFMAPFFPLPNLLLSSGLAHSSLRQAWDQKISSPQSLSEGSITSLVSNLVKAHFTPFLSSADPVDLYTTLKSLSWKILLRLFLGLDIRDKLFTQVESLQEDLLRGQFSVFPVSVNLPWIWQSPRSKGIAAKSELQKLLLAHVKKGLSTGTSTISGGCPFSPPYSPQDANNDGRNEDLANHLLLFTSSLTNKALSSLLLAYLANLFLSPTPLSTLEAKSPFLLAALLETERLSPPIVGVMRRSLTTSTLTPHSPSHAPTLIPSGWDTWLYFVAACRDPLAFGPECNIFNPSRFLDPKTPQPPTPSSLAFSAGRKECLGKDLTHTICLSVAKTLLDMGVGLEGNVGAPGVRAWLGWEEASPKDWARDMRQLPTQHPVVPLMARVRRQDERAAAKESR